MSDDIEALRAFIGLRDESSGWPDNGAIDARAALERLIVDRDSLRKALDDRYAADIKAAKAIFAETGRTRGLPPNAEVVAWHVAEVERLEKELQDAQDTIMGHEIAGAMFEKDRDSLRAKLERAKEALEPFSLEAHTYDPSTNDGDDVLWMAHKSRFLTIKHLRAARSIWADIQSYAPSHWSDCAVHNAPAMEPGVCDCGGYNSTQPPRENAVLSELSADAPAQPQISDEELQI